MCTFCHQGSIFNKMKFVIAVFICTLFMENYASSESFIQKYKIKPWYKEPIVIDDTSKQTISKSKQTISKSKQTISKSKQTISKACQTKTGLAQKYKIKPWYKEPSVIDGAKCSSNTKQVKRKTNPNTSFSYKDEKPQNISFYTGTFDLIDKEGDDKTTLVGIEHKNKDLFRDSWLGKISPTSGAFVTGKSSVYLYTGIEADYNLGRVNISPSFAPGYYEAGDGKNLGSALEFKTEVKIGIDLFKNSNLGYSYSHISNNDWGSTNPGTDNQSINFSKKF